MKKLPILLGSSALVLLGALIYPQLERDDSAQPPGPDIPVNAGADTSDATSVGAAEASPSPRQPETANSPPDSSREPASFDPETVERYAQLQTHRPNTQLTLEEYANAVKKNRAWEPRADAPAGLELSDEEKFDGRSFIKLDRNKIASLIPGDTLELEIPDSGRQHSLRVEDIHIHGDGTESLTGSLQGLDPEYSATITQGDATTLMGITTESGHHTLEARGEDGWVIATGSNVEHAPESVYSQFVAPEQTQDTQGQ